PSSPAQPPSLFHALARLQPLLTFFFTHTPPPDIYTLSLHDALPIPSPASRCPFTTACSRTASDCCGGCRPSSRSLVGGRRRRRCPRRARRHAAGPGAA